MKPMLAQMGDEDWLLEIEPDPDWIATRKWRGIRLILLLNNTGNRLLTRSGRNVIRNVPQFQSIIPELDGTILDSEGTTSSDYLGDVQSVFQSDHPISTSRNIKLELFDCLKYKNRSIIGFPLKERREYLKRAYQVLKRNRWNVALEKLIRRNKKTFYSRIVEAGGEGVMTKDLQASYYPGQRTGAWIKVKLRNTYDFVILGFTRGTGKYSNQIGAIKYGAYYEGELVEVGRSSGMTDQERLDMTNRPKAYINKVAEFEAQELSNSGAMIHPEYIQLRPDIKPIEIQLETYLF